METELRDYLDNDKKNKSFFRAISSIGKEFNIPSWRFMKAELITRMLVSCFPELKYVDKKGYDALFNELRVSIKTQAGLFLKTKSETKEIAIKNTLGAKGVFEKDFDILLMIQTKAPFAMAISTFEEVDRVKKITSDQIKAKLNFDQIDFIVKTNEITISEEEKIDIYSKLSNHIDDLCNEVINE